MTRREITKEYRIAYRYWCDGCDVRVILMRMTLEGLTVKESDIEEWIEEWEEGKDDNFPS